MIRLKPYIVLLVTTTLLTLSGRAQAARGDGGLRADAGLGLGMEYGGVGGMLGVDARLNNGLGVSASVGLGPWYALGGYLWSPGRQWRFGLGLAYSRPWSDRSPQADCSDDPESPQPSCYNERPRIDLAAGAQLAVDNELGEPGGWAVRCGIGAGVIIVDSSGAATPTFTLGARYAFPAHGLGSGVVRR